jgi:hypothetical protein
MATKRSMSIAGACLLALFTILKIGSTLGQSAPGLSIAMTNGNTAVSLVVTNGTNTAKYQIYRTEFLATNADWHLVTNGGTGVTNFTISIEDRTSGFFEARNNTNTLPFVLNLIIASPANGANIQ